MGPVNEGHLNFPVAATFLNLYGMRLRVLLPSLRIGPRSPIAGSVGSPPNVEQKKKTIIVTHATLIRGRSQFANLKSSLHTYIHIPQTLRVCAAGNIMWPGTVSSMCSVDLIFPFINIAHLLISLFFYVSIRRVCGFHHTTEGDSESSMYMYVAATLYVFPSRSSWGGKRGFDLYVE